MATKKNTKKKKDLIITNPYAFFTKGRSKKAIQMDYSMKAKPPSKGEKRVNRTDYPRENFYYLEYFKKHNMPIPKKAGNNPNNLIPITKSSGTKKKTTKKSSAAKTTKKKTTAKKTTAKTDWKNVKRPLDFYTKGRSRDAILLDYSLKAKPPSSEEHRVNRCDYKDEDKAYIAYFKKHNLTPPKKQTTTTTTKPATTKKTTAKKTTAKKTASKKKMI